MPIHTHTQTCMRPRFEALQPAAFRTAFQTMSRAAQRDPTPNTVAEHNRAIGKQNKLASQNTPPNKNLRAISSEAAPGTTYPPCELDIFLHDRYALRMNGA